MLKRILSSIIALPLLFFFVIKGGNFLLIAAFIINIIALFEFYASFKGNNIKPINIISYFVTTLLYLMLFFYFRYEVYMFLILTLISTSLGVVVFSNKYKLSDVAITILGFFYITFSISHIVMIDKIDNGFFIWYIFILAWVSDTSAYFVGSLLGRRKLIPNVSPNKTVEGAIGGVIGAIVVSYLYSFIFNKEFLLFSIFLGLLGSVFSQIGDLIASKIKRINGVKDFGNIMPGHGGVLDRFDSIIFTGPLVYYVVLLYQYMAK
ncbi:phosphatidate cytidylyltransferase [Helicovermis profundi]|uniref:Phosphatidate cytidylyltransferase n=1 Tax=Helicovermis profundi TaxID=3065157 RepID=A0AAU9EF28_9FIRM|nr:phosphatidate cytidylyltransferase [Clostridia bacterium S502]